MSGEEMNENAAKPTRENSEPIDVMGPTAIALMDQQVEELKKLMKDSVGYSILIITKSPVADENGKDLKHRHIYNTFPTESLVDSYYNSEGVILASYGEAKKKQSS